MLTMTKTPSLLPVFLFLFLFTNDTIAAYDSIFSFGDSLADTGNFIRTRLQQFPNVANFPYGQTYFHKPTGRFSDGRLVIDFLAKEFGVPNLAPYLSLNYTNFRQGVNFAVGGATALDSKSFYDHQIRIPWTNNTLGVQLEWFRNLKSSLCNTKQECEEYFRKSLFMMGEIGANDYNYAFFAGLTIKNVRPLIPLVVEAIAGAVSILIEEGAVNIMVPGNLPMGCITTYLTMFQSPNKEDYEPRNGCLKMYNAFAKSHNLHLKRALKGLALKHPQANIIYVDYYAALKPLFRTPLQYGFKEDGALRACCGSGGLYNYNNSAMCGHTGSTVCRDPSEYVNWDGIHLTESAYRHIAMALIHEASL